MIRRNQYAILAVALSTLGILIATLHSEGTVLPAGWSFTLTSGDAALAELIANLLLFIPLGASLVLAGVRPWRAIAIGAALSFSVEFLQQWIPGRDPSTGDITTNTISTAIGVALVVFAPRWLLVPPRRAAWQALGNATLAILVWLGTGSVLRPIVPDPPYHDVLTPEWNQWGPYRGRVLSSNGGISDRNLTFAIRATVLAADRPPRRVAPLIAILDRSDTKVLIFGVDRRDLTLRYNMRALPLTLDQPDLRWRGALAAIAPHDTFTAQTWRGDRGGGLCFRVNAAQRCGYGYTIGDGWKLIYYPEHFPDWLLGTINMLWITGWTIGIGYWAGRAGNAPVRVAAVALIVGGLLLVPVLTQLKVTPVHEWLGAVLGLGIGYLVGVRVSAQSDIRPHSA